MDRSSKENFSETNGTEVTEHREVIGSSNKRDGAERSELLLRILAFALTMAAAVILGVNKQTKIVPVKIIDTLPPMNVPVVAKWHYLSAFVFFVASNAIACAYAAISVVLILGTKKTRMTLMVLILDVLMVALLFSSNGATTSLGLMAYRGNSHVRWNKVCNVFGRFCHQVGAAVVLSLLGGIAFVSLAVLAVLRIHSNPK